MSRCYSYLYFAKKGTKAQGEKEHFPRLHSWKYQNQGWILVMVLGAFFNFFVGSFVVVWFGFVCR